MKEVVVDHGGVLAVISDGTGELVAQIPRAQLQGRGLPEVGQGLKVLRGRASLATLRPTHARVSASCNSPEARKYRLPCSVTSRAVRSLHRRQVIGRLKARAADEAHAEHIVLVHKVREPTRV